MTDVSMLADPDQLLHRAGASVFVAYHRARAAGVDPMVCVFHPDCPLAAYFLKKDNYTPVGDTDVTIGAMDVAAFLGVLADAPNYPEMASAVARQRREHPGDFLAACFVGGRVYIRSGTLDLGAGNCHARESLN